MKNRSYRTAVLPTLVLFCCLAIPAAFSSPSHAADEELEPGIGEVPPTDMLPDGAPEEGGETPSGKDLSGPPPSSTPNKQDRSDILGTMPLGDPALRAEVLKELYTQLSGARSAKDAEPIAEAIEETWRHSGSDTVDLLMTRVDSFVLATNLDLAMQVLDAVTELDPENAEVWHQRGIVQLMQNDTQKALADLKRATEIDPKHYKAWRDLGALLQQTGDQRGALDAYRKALAVNPFLEQAKRAEEQLSHEVEGRDI
jgi:regulator of sirC expression with transglutaminase-like and TPR domain